MGFFKRHATLLVAMSGLFIIWLLFFHQPLFSGGIINATDILTQRYFWQVFKKESLLNDPCFKTWLPYINAGTSFGGGLDMLFRPVTFLTTLLLPAHTAINLEFTLYFFLIGVSMFVYMRGLKLSVLSAFLAALFLMLSGQIVSLLNAGHVHKVGAMFPVPLVFWAFERALRRKKLSDFVLTGVLLAFQFWQGHIQISFYLCIAIALYYGVRVGVLWWRDRDARQLSRLTAFAVIMVLVFLLFSAVEFLPLLSFSRVSDRAEGVSYEFATSWSMPPEELMTYLVPQFFGLRRLNHSEDENIVPYWGRMPFTQTSHYLGLLPLILALMAVCFVRNRHVLTLLLIGVVILFLGMGKYIPTYKLLYDYVPGFGQFRVPQMILFLFAFCVAGLAGFGAEWLLSSFSARKEQHFRIMLLFLIVCCLLVWGVTLILPQIQETVFSTFNITLFSRGADQNVAEARFQSIQHGMLCLGMLSGLTLFGLGLRLVPQFPARRVALVLMAVFVLDMWLFNEKYIDTIPLEGSHYISENDAIRYCKENPGLYRILPMTNEPVSYNVSNKYVYHKLASVSGYEAVGVQYYNEYLQQMALGTPLVDLLNIKYIILPKNVELDGEAVEVGKVVGPYKVVMDSDAVLLENLNVLPRAYAVHNAVFSRLKEESFGILLHPDFNPRELVVLEEQPQATLPQNPPPSSASKVEITHYHNRTIRMKASMASDGFLVLSEKFYPGWKAYVDGRPVSIYKANYTFQAIAVPRGEHEIVFAFQPTQFVLGFSITILTGVLLAGVWLSTHTSLQTHMSRPYKKMLHIVRTLTIRLNPAKLTWGLIGMGLLAHTVQYIFNRSLYVDEISLTLNILQRSFGELLQPLGYHQSAPIGFLWVEKFLVLVFGEHEYVLRFFPFVSALLSILLFARLSPAYLRRSAVPFTLALFVLSEPLIFFSSTVKQYSSDVFFALLLYAVARRLQTPRVAWSTAAWVGLLGAVVVWFSHPAVFVLAGIGITLSAAALIRREWRNIGPLVLTTFCWAGSFLGFYVFSLRFLGEDEYLNSFWQGAFLVFPPTSLSEALAPIAQIFHFGGYATGYSQAIFDATQSHSLPRLLESIRQLLTASQAVPLSTIFPLLLLAISCTLVYVLMFGAVIIGGIAMFRRSPVTLGLLSLPLCAAFGASALQKFPLASRVLLFWVPAILLLLGEGISVIRQKISSRFPLIAVIFIIAIMSYPFYSAGYHLFHPRVDQEIRPVLQYVQDHAAPDDTLYVYYATEGAFQYYSRRFEFDDVTTIHGIAGRNNWEVYAQDLNQLQGKDRVWLIFSHVFGYEEEFFVQYVEQLGGKRLDFVRHPKAAAYLYVMPAQSPKQE